MTSSVEVFRDGVCMAHLYTNANATVLVVLVPLDSEGKALPGGTLSLVPSDGPREA